MRPGPAEGGRRGGRRRGAGTSLVKAAKACCSEARRPASAGPPLASPQPCSSSPFAPAGARHGKAPPPHTQPAAPNCATEFMGAGRAEQRRRGGGGGHVRCGLAPGPLRRSAAWLAASPCPPPGPLAPDQPASPTVPAAPRPCLCCSWWLRVRFDSASRTVIFFVLFLFGVASVSRDTRPLCVSRRPSALPPEAPPPREAAARRRG